jgi:hypothetical protein
MIYTILLTITAKYPFARKILSPGTASKTIMITGVCDAEFT